MSVLRLSSILMEVFGELLLWLLAFAGPNHLPAALKNRSSALNALSVRAWKQSIWAEKITVPFVVAFWMAILAGIPLFLTKQTFVQVSDAASKLLRILLARIHIITVFGVTFIALGRYGRESLPPAH